MRFSESFVQEVIDRTDMEELVGRYVTLKRSGSNLMGCCPFHSEKTPSFSVSPTKKMFFCFGCQAGGSVITFVQKAENLDFADAVEYLANRAGIPLPQNSNAELPFSSGVSKKRILDMNLKAAKFFRACLFDPKIGEAGMRYFCGERKLSLATVKHFGLGFAPNNVAMLTDHMHRLGYTDEELFSACLCGKSTKNGKAYDYFRNRVIFPIIDPSGHIVGFGGRVLDDSKPKYLNTSDTPAFKKSKHLFALNFAKNVCSERAVLCEGYMDVIALHAAGFEYAVATLGTAITPEHARIFSKYTKKVIISYDSDEAGQRAANKAMKILSEVGMDVRVLKMSGAKDPDEYIRKFGKEGFSRVLDESKTGFEYKAERILTQYDITIGSEKIKASQALCEVIAEYPSGVEREVYLAYASKHLELPTDVLKNTVEQLRKRNYREYSAKQSREAQTSVKNFGDRINPDAAKEPRAAAAEEAVLGLLLLYEEYRTIVEKQEIALSPADFVTAFHKRVFEAIMQQHRSDSGFHFEMLGEQFSPDEMGRIQKMEITRRRLSQNGIEVFRSAVSVLHDVAKEKELASEDLNARLAYLREKKSKLHKGKAEET